VTLTLADAELEFELPSNSTLAALEGKCIFQGFLKIGKFLITDVASGSVSKSRTARYAAPVVMSRRYAARFKTTFG